MKDGGKFNALQLQSQLVFDFTNTGKVRVCVKEVPSFLAPVSSQSNSCYYAYQLKLLKVYFNKLVFQVKIQHS